MPDIMHLVEIHAPVERVFKALTTQEDISNWWTHDTKIEPRVGATGEFGFSDHQYVITVQVTDLKPPTRIEWKALSAGPAWTNTTIIFELRPQGSDTHVAFAHRGFKNADDDYARPTTRWGYYLVSLKQYLETGKGTPDPDDSDF